MIDSSSDRNPVEALAEEFVERYPRGERPTLAEYAARYPALADDIRELFPALLLMENIRPEPGEGTGSYESGPTLAAGKKLERLGDYRILREVGRGGMGIVYEAEQESLGRHVALKVLPAHTLLDPRRLQRFHREARAVARLHHTNIVPVYGVGEHEGLHYYVMQLIQGQGLDEVLRELRRLRKARKAPGEPPPVAEPSEHWKRGEAGDMSAADVAHALLTGQFAPAPSPAESPAPDRIVAERSAAPAAPPTVADGSGASDAGSIHLPGPAGPGALSESGRHYWQSVARIGVQVAEALAYAHSQRTLHRDIKPSNLLLDTHGTVWVTDFGLAKAADSDDLTESGDIVGTVRYMAPERFTGHADARSDIYSLGLTLYELLTLAPAFRGSERNQLLDQVQRAEPPPPRKVNPEAPRDLETVVLKAIVKDPAHRYQTPQELAEDLKRFLEDKPIQARRASPAERLWRWARRNPLVASLTAAVALLLLAGTVGGTMAAVYFGRAAQEEERLKEEAEGARDREKEERQHAEHLAEESRQRLVRLHVERGVRLMDSGDLSGAAVVFAEALKLDEGDAAREALHRLRLGAVLPHCPRPTHVWRHDRPVLFAAFSPDGRRVVTADGSRNLVGKAAKPAEARVWDVATGRPLTPPLKHEGTVVYAAFSPDGRHVVTASYDGTARVWDASTGVARTGPLKHGGEVHQALFSPDGRVLLTVSRATLSGKVAPLATEGEWRLWDAASGAPRTQPRKERLLWHAAFSPDGRRVVTAGELPKVWDADTGKLLVTLYTDQRVSQALFSPDGRRVATAGLVSQVWDATSGALVATTGWHEGAIGDLAFSPDGRFLVTASWDQHARVWEADTGKLVAARKHAGNVVRASFSPNGRHVLSAGFDATVQVWEAATGALVCPPLRHAAEVEAASFSPDGRRVVTASADATARLWDLATAEPAPLRFSHGSRVAQAEISPDGRRIVTRADHTARLWEAATGKLLAELLHDGSVVQAAFGPNGRLVATLVQRSAQAADGKTVARGELRLWEAATGKEVRPRLSMDSVVYCLAFSPDGGRLATGGWLQATSEAEVRVWDVATGREAAPRLKQGSPVTLVAFSPDGGRLLTAASREAARLWDLATGKLLRTLESAVIQAAFSPDGRRLVLCRMSFKATLLDAVTGAKVATLAHTGIVRQAAFSPDSRHVVTASVDSTARVWSAADGAAVGPPLKHSGFVTHAQFSGDGRRVVTTGVDRAAQIWDALTGDPLGPPLLHSDATEPAAFSPDGRHVLTALSRGYSRSTLSYPIGDGAALLWDVAPDDRPVAELVREAQGLAERYLGAKGEFVALDSERSQEALQAWQRRGTAARAASPAQVRAWHHKEAAAAERAGHWAAAVFHLDRLIDLEPGSAMHHHRRGHALAEQEQWDKAAADYARAFALEPDSWVIRHRHAVLRLQLKDLDGYRQTCASALDRRDPTPDLFKDNAAAWVCAVGPGAAGDTARAVKLAERALAAAPGSANYLNTLGAVLYRAGRYEEAVKRLNESMQARSPEGTVHDWIFLAMAHQHLGHATEAQGWLDKATRWIDRALNKRASSASLYLSTTVWNQRWQGQLLLWDERLELQVLRREAEALLRGKGAVPPK
jgi:WD40 repeat protein/serine/threonine protein kinase/tetratricopeptide (TPR) repeat protein